MQLIILIVLIAYCECCPFPCICRWKNGKQTAECVNKDLLVIPEGLDSTTQVLEFSGNNLRTLHRNKFLKLDLINLQRIYLSRCRISIIEDRTFEGLTNLVELDLADNLLDVIPSGSFQDCPSLMRLTLSRNPIKALERAAFNYLSSLNTLDLSNCDISRVEDGAFHGLYSLEWLHLDANKITSLPGSLPAGLKGVQLQENPWKCDCHIVELHEWLLKFSFPLSFEPICSGPARLADRVIKSVPKTDLACLPDVTPTTLYVEIDQGKNISLVCQVHAIPEATVNWYFEGQLLQNDSFLASGVHILFYIERGTIQKRSELFIYNANTEDNGTFICNAENPAGTSHANFTIKVILKQETTIKTEEIPFEFILMVASAAAVSVILLLFVAILSALKCNKNSRLRKKRDNLKVALRNSSKDIRESTDDSAQLNDNSTAKLESQEEELMLYSSHPSEELLRSLSPHVTTNQLEPLKCYHEQNPDLINGTESIERPLEYDMLIRGHQLMSKNPSPAAAFNLHTIKESECNLPPAATAATPPFAVMSGDLRLNPVGLLNTGGGGRPPQSYANACYRTLPNKRRTAAVPIGRFSREAEFLSRSAVPAYEHFGCDVRYTADGYPVRTMDETQPTTAPAVVAPSPVESHKSGSSTSTAEPCCSSVAKALQMQRPYVQQTRVEECPENRIRVPVNLTLTRQDTLVKKCVGAQTQTDCSIVDSMNCDKRASDEIVDEGYEGEDEKLHNN